MSRYGENKGEFGSEGYKCYYKAQAPPGGKSSNILVLMSQLLLSLLLFLLSRVIKIKLKIPLTLLLPNQPNKPTPISTKKWPKKTNPPASSAT